ncbi:uncharacterized protein LOC112089176 [Eutrema salsugineum]|uniref:uncharacterized protein LOC112089176 n=1 Tax=Eutrema salsugineum TaxID=72664 RepID=UPI000CED12FA|nr:uncharacterized protein LOC112089176 [Eutrema salsugineum]
MLDRHNRHVKAFRTVQDKFGSLGDTSGLRLKLEYDRTSDGRTTNFPTAKEVAALVPNDFDVGIETRDIIIESRSGRLKRISELHPAYLPLQYPLLFPYGEDGFRLGIDIGYVDKKGKKRLTITMREFFAFRVQERFGESPTIVMSGRLYQQFLVDAFTMIETNRLRFISMNPQKLRSEIFDNIKDAADKGNSDLSEKGRRIFIPASFTGGTRDMLQHYLDTMATCKHFGFPDLFITFTCNPKWPEITRHLQRHNLKAEDRPDLCARVFKMKLDDLMYELTKKNVLGVVNAAIYTIEFQKRGLPHAHIVLFLRPEDKLPTGDDIDKIICAEIPDKETDPHLYEIIGDVMMHGPCGALDRDSVCMADGRCTKFFPKAFSPVTKVDDVGYPIYRRREDKRFVTRKGFNCDNGYVVPYNRELYIRYRARINVEWCIQSRSVKYLFKYIHKRADYVRAVVGKDDEDDEVKKHFNCRYISPGESIWRIEGYDTHSRTVSVTKLPFHLPNQHLIIYNEDDPAEEVVRTCYRWKWKPRKKGKTIGRITYVPMSVGEAYYLRLLLNIVIGPTCFEDIRTVKGHHYDTFKEVCFVLGLLDDDKEYIEAIKDASLWVSTITRIGCSYADYKKCFYAFEWDATWDILSEDVLYTQRKFQKKPDLRLSTEQVKNLCLAEIEMLLRTAGSSLTDFSCMLYLDDLDMTIRGNPLIRDEKSYDRDYLRVRHDELFATITDEQRLIYDEILEAVYSGSGGRFFVYGFGGTGKTYLWSLLGAALRSKGDIVLNVASSGIAALLLQGGRTAHSRFAIPIVVNRFTTCAIKSQSNLAELIDASKLIIWDEALMMSRDCYETLDRTLKDILKCDKPFGGKVIVFGGDFRQILLVIPNAGKTEILMATPFGLDVKC